MTRPRYVAEPGSDTVRDAMDRTDGWVVAQNTGVSV